MYYNNSNLFPKYTNWEDENLYLNIYNFFKKWYSKWWKNMAWIYKNIKNTKKKHKKLLFHRKIGFFNIKKELW